MRTLQAKKTVPLGNWYPERPSLTDPARGGCGGRRDLLADALAPLDYDGLVVDPLIVRFWRDVLFDELYTGKPDKWN